MLKLTQGCCFGRGHLPAGEEVFVIPVVPPRPSPLELTSAPGPITGTRFTPEEQVLIVNSCGAERAKAAEAAVIVELTGPWPSPQGLALTLPYSPGYCGMALTEQRALFAVLGGDRVGVRLSADCTMVPLKSVSGL